MSNSDGTSSFLYKNHLIHQEKRQQSECYKCKNDHETWTKIIGYKRMKIIIWGYDRDKWKENVVK